MKKELQGLLGRIRRVLLHRGRTAGKNLPKPPVNDASKLYIDITRECWNFAASFDLVELIEYEGEDAPVIAPAENYAEQVATYMREYIESKGYKIKRCEHPQDGEEG